MLVRFPSIFKDTICKKGFYDVNQANTHPLNQRNSESSALLIGCDVIKTLMQLLGVFVAVVCDGVVKPYSKRSCSSNQLFFF